MKVSHRNFQQMCRQLLSAVAIISISACGGGGSGGGEAPRSQIGEKIPAQDQRVIPTEEVSPFRADSPYASVLYSCIMVPELREELCPLSELPYIGQTTNVISIDQIMQRVLVSHDWMGVRFEEMLRIMPRDLVQLFAPVTAIVIGSDVRPSSFTPALGMIMLDPEYLWLSTAERKTISVDEDFRTDFGADLQFVGLSRVLSGEEYTSYFWPEGTERKHEYIEISLARVLYHELAHANDYVQRESLAALDRSGTAFDTIEQLSDRAVSTLLANDASLTTPDVFFDELADVRFRDAEPTEQHSTAQSDFVGAMLAAAGKIQFYSYVSTKEDVATLFEAAMMKYHYNVDTHVAFANKPADEENAQCNDYIIGWGVRNRLASSLVIPRANFVVQSIMQAPYSITNLLDNRLGPVVPLREGDGWCESRTFSPSPIFNDQPSAPKHHGIPIEIRRSMQQDFK